MANNDTHTKEKGKPTSLPPQHEKHQPGTQREMNPQPRSEPQYQGSAHKLEGQRAVITGGDSGIGRAVAIAFAREGADVSIVYLTEDEDAQATKQMVEKEGRKCVLLKGDVGDENFCRQAIEQADQQLGGLNILVNNAAEQHPQKSIEDITEQQLEKTFRTNFFGYFFMAKAAIPKMTKGGVIINTTSVTAYRGSPELLDYSATKGAIVAFTRSLSQAIVDKGIRVNAVAPGPIWTPLIPSTFTEKDVAEFGKDVPMKRSGQPDEVAPCYVFLASSDSSYMTGQVLHPNGGEMVES